MIPKRIFYVWGYGEKKSILANVCLENWRIVMPDYEIIEINEHAPQWFDFEYEYNNNLWFKTVYDLKIWAYVSDYMRLSVLYNHGGIYLDTDVTVYKRFDDLLSDKCFCGNTLVNTPEPAVIGAVKGNRIIKETLDFYKERIWKEKVYIVPHIFEIAFKKFYDEEIKCDKLIIHDDIKIYPYYYFCPSRWADSFKKEDIRPETYTMHWAKGSWWSKKNLYFLSNKHRVPLNILLKQMKFIEKVDKNANERVTIK